MLLQGSTLCGLDQAESFKDDLIALHVLIEQVGRVVGLKLG